MDAMDAAQATARLRGLMESVLDAMTSNGHVTNLSESARLAMIRSDVPFHGKRRANAIDGIILFIDWMQDPANREALALQMNERDIDQVFWRERMARSSAF